MLRNDCTSVCILTSCWEAMFIFVRVRIVTVTQTANVPRMIIPKTTQDGMIPPRLRTSARLPIMSKEISRTGAKAEVALGATR
jgi:preprotein translocase subunit SecB